MTQRAPIAGASGIARSNLADLRLDRGWEVVGLARRPPEARPGYRTVAADLLDAGPPRGPSATSRSSPA